MMGLIYLSMKLSVPKFRTSYFWIYAAIEKAANTNKKISLVFFFFYFPILNLLSLCVLNFILHKGELEFVSKRTDKRPVHLIYNLYKLTDHSYLQKYFLLFAKIYEPFLSKELAFSLQMSGVIVLEDGSLARKILYKNNRESFLSTYRHYQMFTLFYQGRHDEILSIIEGLEEKFQGDIFPETIVSINIPLSLSLSDEPKLSAYYYLAYFFENPSLKILEIDEFWKYYVGKLEAHLRGALSDPGSVLDSDRKVGLFFFSQPKAIGHVVQDPFCFLSLYRNEYDEIYFIGETEKKYSPACRAGLEIIKQYGTYIAVNDPFLTQLNWMNHGVFKIGSATVHVQNHWSLLREMMHKHFDAVSSYQHGVWSMDIPKEIHEKGGFFLKKHHINLSKPIICLNVREHQYHNNNIQKHRNASASQYETAIEFLLKAGYQIIRLGDRRMSRLIFQTQGYFELPFMDGYDHTLDIFFIKNSYFMIGAQSGPCAYARTMGIPLLSVNAIFDFAHLPAYQEMGCSRKLYQNSIGKNRYIPTMELLERNLFLIASAFQFEENELFFEETTPEEILEAVKDMLAWLENEKLPLTVEQVTFSMKANETHQRQNHSPPLTPRISNFFSYSLPNYRISPTVEKMRGNTPICRGLHK